MRFLMKWRFTETETGITLVTGFYTANSPVLVEMALTERIVKDIPTGSIGYAAIIPKEDDFLEFECPHFIEAGRQSSIPEYRSFQADGAH
ncbi:hypothetical protein [Klebsiella pneumoniae]|uniref:hypothetical protein n=1 Tax=Klebsiella pneumoniae TaxID=573 RepID=UPI00403AEC32